MTAASHDRDSSAARRPLTNIYEELRRRNARHADLARRSETRNRIERALQVARQRALRDRG
jgi:hypothetical protein